MDLFKVKGLSIIFPVICQLTQWHKTMNLLCGTFEFYISVISESTRLSKCFILISIWGSVLHFFQVMTEVPLSHGTEPLTAPLVPWLCAHSHSRVSVPLCTALI